VNRALFALLTSVVVNSALGESTEPTSIRITTGNLQWLSTGSANDASIERRRHLKAAMETQHTHASLHCGADTKPTGISNTVTFGFSPCVSNVLWVLTVLNRSAATTCQARPDIEIRHDPTTQILAISLKERFVSSGSESGG
jgi:hypothetical protein